MNPTAQRQPKLCEHPMVYCAHCGAEQRKSLVIGAGLPAPTVCLSCGGAVLLVGGLWMERLSELSPEGFGVAIIRNALAQAGGAWAR